MAQPNEVMTQQEVTPALTPATEWKRATHLMELSNGRVIEYREIDVPGLIISSENGNIPDLITQSLARDLKGEKPPEFEAKDLPDYSKFINVIVKTALVYPKIVETNPNYENGEILLDDIDFMDRAEIMNRLMPEMELAIAHKFRSGQGAGLGTTQSGKAVRRKTKRAAGTH